MSKEKELFRAVRKGCLGKEKGSFKPRERNVRTTKRPFEARERGVRSTLKGVWTMRKGRGKIRGVK